jgi:hypothetical protein
MATRRMKPRGGPEDDEIDEGPSEADLEKFGGVTRPCPECGTELYDDAEICWKCGHAISGESKGLPIWVIVASVVALAGMLFFLIR